MPYIVTTVTHRGWCGCRTGLKGSGYHHDRSCQSLKQPVSRRAVAAATLEEARNEVNNEIGKRYGSGIPGRGRWVAVENLPESGGTVGPLADGTLIEVEPVTDDDLYAVAGKPTITYRSPAQRRDLIVAVFNAAQAVAS